MIVIAPASSFSASTLGIALLAVAFAALVVPIGASLRKKMRVSEKLKPIPGPKGVPLLGMLPEILKHAPRVHEFYESILLQYGGRAKFPWSILADNSVWVTTPEDVQWILADNTNNYIRTERTIDAVGRAAAGAFVSLNHAHTPDNGAMIRLQRKVGMRVFTTNNFKQFTEQIFRKYATEMVAVVKQHGGKIDMHEVSSQYTLQAIFDISCGVPLKELDPSLGLAFIHAMDYVFAYVSERLISRPYYRYLRWVMPSEYKMHRSEQVMIDLADSILLPRLQESEADIAPRADIMSLYIKKARELEKEEGEGAAILDTKTLRSILLSFVFAGKDTTSSVITYTFYALAQYPDIQQKLFEEVSQAEELTYESVKNLKYLDAVVNETMRLYPTVPSNFRIAVEDDHLPDGTFIPAGTEVFFSSWYMGRHNPVFGEHREQFRPERWLEMKTRPSAYDFPVFHAGPRICIGMNMGIIEARVFIAVMVREFHVQMQEGEKLLNRGYILCPTMTMEGGLPLQLTERK